METAHFGSASTDDRRYFFDCISLWDASCRNILRPSCRVASTANAAIIFLGFLFMPDCHLTSYPTLVLNLILVQDESTIRTPRSRRFLQSITPYPFDSPLLLLVSTFSCRRSLLNTFPRFIRPQKTMSYSSYSSGAATWQERLEG
jgi:hypothetical protein